MHPAGQDVSSRAEAVSLAGFDGYSIRAAVGLLHQRLPIVRLVARDFLLGVVLPLLVDVTNVLGRWFN
jgi:hypothetical protein